ncbi:response regulator [[Phormidium] sp. LEGE 05292]|uniref:response regulator n=1 Tax=[Phormidium] sp. LEGE 05292 TaxID=767427 RepID=UPI001D158A10|nr:response regulator [Phormidium sp. LEGE 05292]
MTTLRFGETTIDKTVANSTIEITPLHRNSQKIGGICPMFNKDMLCMSTKRVLIIDDEPDVRAVVQGCLEDVAGWDVVTAASGQEGLVKVIADKPDGIVLDVMMPGMDGLAFLRELRSRPEGRSIPVILLSAKVNLTDPQVIFELRIKGIISKPFDPFILTEEIAHFFGWEMEEYI